MSLDRRAFLQTAVVAGAVGATNAQVRGGRDPARSFGVLVDIPNCIGCRKCEFACQEAAGDAPPAMETFDDKTVLALPRRLDTKHLTILNQYPNPHDPSKPLFVKANCLHCVDPACASACLVGALQKDENGAVTYDAWKCMGCRYCMIACPFQIPTYEYSDAFAPRVRKCSFCFDRISKEGGLPACVKICPRECLTFGRRQELLDLAHRRIAEHPRQYIDHVYGEHEAGGTAWLYLSSVPFETVGFASVGNLPPHHLTEAIQHGVFKGWMPPLALYGLLALTAWIGRRQSTWETRLPSLDQELASRPGSTPEDRP